jgi:hypothetical protein
MGTQMKPKVLIQSLLVTVIVLVIASDYFLDISALKMASDSIKSWVVPISSLALLGGVIGLYFKHGTSVIKQEENWPFDLVTVVALTVTIAAGYLSPTAFNWIYDNISRKIFVAMSAYYMMFLISSGYRAFKVRNVDATILLVTTIMTLLANTPAAAAAWSGIPIIGNWIMDVPAMAAMRAINVGVALGTFGLAVRTMLGEEATISVS